MTFEQFQATRQWRDNLSDMLSDEMLEGISGQSYLGCLYIEAADSIECATGPYLLTIGRDQTFGELEALERDLYDWAMAEGYGE